MVPQEKLSWKSCWHWNEVLSDGNRKVNDKTEKEMPFVATFHPRLKILQKIIDRNLYLLYMNQEVKKPLHLNLWFHVEVPAKSVVI